MMNSDYLLLDSAILAWVVVPMLIMVTLVGMGRQYVQTVLKSEPKMSEGDMKELECKATLGRSHCTRNNGRFICERAFNMRRAYMIRKKVGLLREKDLPRQTNPMQNMNTMMDMLKGNVSYMVPNVAMMSFVSYFFSGFVCLKMPFSMPSTHFKVMLQRGVDLSNLDVSYVSSLSWYFLLMFGLNDVYALILGESPEMDEAQRMMQMQMGMMGSQPGFDASALYKQEKDMMSIAKHEWVADLHETMFLGDRYPDTSDAPAIDLSMFSKR